jgi:hypothetical protein
MSFKAFQLRNKITVNLKGSLTIQDIKIGPITHYNLLNLNIIMNAQ